MVSIIRIFYRASLHMLSSNEIFIANEVTNATKHDSIYVINMIDTFFVGYRHFRNNYFFIIYHAFYRASLDATL